MSHEPKTLRDAVKEASALMLASWPAQARHVVPNDHVRSMATAISDLKAEAPDVQLACIEAVRHSQFLPSAAEFRSKVISAMARRGAGPKARHSLRFLPCGNTEPLVHVFENGQWRWKSPREAHESPQALPDAAKQGRAPTTGPGGGKNDALREEGEGR